MIAAVILFIVDVIYALLSLKKGTRIRCLVIIAFTFVPPIIIIAFPTSLAEGFGLILCFLLVAPVAGMMSSQSSPFGQQRSLLEGNPAVFVLRFHIAINVILGTMNIVQMTKVDAEAVGDENTAAQFKGQLLARTSLYYLNAFWTPLVLSEIFETAPNSIRSYQSWDRKKANELNNGAMEKAIVVSTAISPLLPLLEFVWDEDGNEIWYAALSFLSFILIAGSNYAFDSPNRHPVLNRILWSPPFPEAMPEAEDEADQELVTDPNISAHDNLQPKGIPPLPLLPVGRAASPRSGRSCHNHVLSSDSDASSTDLVPGRTSGMLARGLRQIRGRSSCGSESTSGISSSSSSTSAGAGVFARHFREQYAEQSNSPVSTSEAMYRDSSTEEGSGLYI